MRLLTNILLSSLTFFIFPLTTFSQENTSSSSQIIVTATRIETPIDQIGKSVSVIDSKQIEENGNSQIGDLLQSLPSMRVRRNGGPGTFSPIQMRGSTPGQVLLLINGFPVLDAANFGGNPSDLFQNLFMDDVERIEVVRGPLSTLYGADALGGTINIITKKGTEDFSGDFFFEGGTKNTFRESAQLRGTEKNINYALNVIRNDSDGLDAHDVFNATTLSTRIGAKLTDNLNMDASLRYTKSRVNFDEFGSAPNFKEIDDPTRLQQTDALFWGIEFRHQTTQNWEQKCRYSYNLIQSGIDDEIDAADLPNTFGQLVRTKTEGITHNIELLENYYGLKDHTLTLGLEYEREEADASTSLSGIASSRIVAHVDNKAVFLQDTWALFEKLFLTSGVRFDHFASFGTTINYTFSAAYLLKEIGAKLKANVGTAFNDPSLTQLFDPLFGNPNLDPEEVIGFDCGIEKKLFNDKVWLNASFFRQNYKELISISRVVTASGVRFQAVNSGKALAQGLEFESRFELSPKLHAGVNYTLTDSELKQVNTRIPEIPDAQVSIFANYKLFDKILLHLNVDFVDDSLITSAKGFPKNEAHTTVDLAMSYEVNPKIKIFGRIENLFNEKYKDDTLKAPGLFAFGGVSVQF